ncbi:MAG: hypothetical protein GXP31_16950 [Kiritimatiellaeota bacterium]|nr:hypothetical protein [Kiritimatiellota bacterium]
MPYHISIRRTTAEEADAFAAGEVRALEGAPFRVGGAPESDYVLPGAAEAVFRPASDGSGWALHPAAGAPPGSVRVNGAPASAPIPLKTGDEIRIGDCLIRFEQVFEGAETGRHADLVALAARVLVGLILVGELLVVTWLPKRLHGARLWDREVARQQTTMFLDRLRTKIGELTPANPVEAGIREALSTEVDRLARFLRIGQEGLSAEAWRELRRDLDRYESVLERLRSHTALAPLPGIDVDGAVQAVAGASAEDRISPSTPHDR